MLNLTEHPQLVTSARPGPAVRSSRSGAAAFGDGHHDERARCASRPAARAP